MPITLPLFYKKDTLPEGDNPPRKRSRAFWIIVAVLVNLVLATSAIIVSERLKKEEYVPPEEVTAECPTVERSWIGDYWLCALQGQTSTCIYEYEIARETLPPGVFTFSGTVYRNSGDEQLNEDVLILIDGVVVFESDDFPGSPEYETFNFEREVGEGEHVILTRHADGSDSPSSPGSVTLTLTLDYESSCPSELTHWICSGESCIEVSGEGTDGCATDADCVTRNHKECVGRRCVKIDGKGVDGCTSDSDCVVSTHKECVSEQCVDVSGEGSDQCATDADCTTPSQTHRECLDESCVVVDGGGVDECVVDSDCVTSSTHLVCSGSSCISVSGAGTDECTTDADCATGSPPSHKSCVNNQCLSVSGAGTDTCQTDSDCVAEVSPSPSQSSPSAEVPATAWVIPSLTVLVISFVLVVFGVLI